MLAFWTLPLEYRARKILRMTSFFFTSFTELVPLQVWVCSTSSSSYPETPQSCDSRGGAPSLIAASLLLRKRALRSSKQAAPEGRFWSSHANSAGGEHLEMGFATSSSRAGRSSFTGNKLGPPPWVWSPSTQRTRAWCSHGCLTSLWGKNTEHLPILKGSKAAKCLQHLQ